MKYEIPKEIKSPAKIIFSLLGKDLLILLFGSLILLTVTDDVVHSWLKIPYYVVGFGFLLFLVWNAPTNQGKKNYQALYYLVKRKRVTYHPLDIHSIENNELLFNEKERR
ncbi:DUF5592 family protein [Paenibacillus larvae]